jgi:hypothetical protein
VIRASRAILRPFTLLALTMEGSFREGGCSHGTRRLNPECFSGTCNFQVVLPGSGQKVEVAENKPLNPSYPVLELHVV